MTKNYQPGELVLAGNQTYIAIHPLRRGDCLGCDFKHHNGDFNECHAPDSVNCKDCVFKKHKPASIDYEEMDIDLQGCKHAIIIISTAIGALMAALATAIYYSI